MRNARSLFSLGRKALVIVLAGGFCFCGWGCQHHHYYYYGASGVSGACPPGTVMPSTVVNGEVCEVPSEVDSGTMVSSRSTIIDNGRKRSQVVVSEPSGRLSSRLGWRSSNPEDVPVMTHVDGALDSSVK